MQKEHRIISLKEARKLYLSSQGLLANRSDNQEIIENLSYVQIDTISVIERAHHHVFWSRNSSYHPDALNELMDKRQVFEYWSHAAAILPMEDYRFSMNRKLAFRKRETNWLPKDKKLMKYVLDRIKAEGPLRSADFKSKASKKSNGWWDWNPTKKALERLFQEGKLEVTARKGFQKVYDLPERVIPSHIVTKPPTEAEYANYLIKCTLKHHDFFSIDECAYLRKASTKAAIKKQILKKQKEGSLIKLQIETLESTFFTTPQILDQIPTTRKKNIQILSPFDNSIIQRKKLKYLFNFDFQLECYVPAPKRKYGYFALPILYGDQFVGRVDCKADRKSKDFLVNKLFFEKHQKPKQRDSLQPKVLKKLEKFAKFNQCERVIHKA